MTHFLSFNALAVVMVMGAGLPAVAQTVGTAGVPTGFGLAGGVVALSASGSYGPERNPPADSTRYDGSGSVMLGFGDPVAGLGVQGGVNITSFRDFGESGYLSLGAHKMFQINDAGLYSVALNVSHIEPWGDAELLDPGVSLVGSYMTSIGGRLALISLGAATDTNDARDVEAVFGFGVGLNDNLAVSIGQVGQRTALGMTFSPAMLAGNSLSLSVNHDHDTGDNTFVVDLGRAFSLFKN
jgi:hypothetical protein